MIPEDAPRDAPPPDGETFRLRPQHHAAAPPPDTSTVHLGGGAVYGAPMPSYEATPTVFTPTTPVGEEAPAESLIRFGPGVPDPETARTMAVWQGAGPAGAAGAEAAGQPKRRLLGGFLLAALVLAAVAGFLLWQRFGTPLAVSSVTVSASPVALGCDGTESIVATVHTNGSSGTLHYRWVRSDGTDSGVLSQGVASGLHQVQLPLRWTFQGPDHMQATATLELTSPSTRSASANFNYSC